MGFLKLIEMLENADNAANISFNSSPAVSAAKVSMTPEQRERLEKLRAKRSGSLSGAPQEQRSGSITESPETDFSSGSITDFVETENIEFHEESHRNSHTSEPIKPPHVNQVPAKYRFTPYDARRGFVYSEILGKPLALRKKH